MHGSACGQLHKIEVSHGPLGFLNAGVLIVDADADNLERAGRGAILSDLVAQGILVREILVDEELIDYSDLL